MYETKASSMGIETRMANHTTMEMMPHFFACFKKSFLSWPVVYSACWSKDNYIECSVISENSQKKLGVHFESHG